MRPAGVPPGGGQLIATHSRASLVVLALLVLSASAPGAWSNVEPAGPGDPTVTDGLHRLGRRELQGTPLGFLSGLRTHTITATFQGTNNEVLSCSDGQVQFRSDGRAPSSGFLASRFGCLDGGAPATRLRFQGQIEPAQLSAGGGDHVRLRLVVPMVPSGTATDDNRGAYYQYRVDDSSPRPRLMVPSSEPGQRTVVTSDSKSALVLRVVDDETQAPLVLESVRIELDGSNATHLFECKPASSHQVECGFDWGEAPPDFKWHDGLHTMKIWASDQVGNPVDPNEGELSFVVDYKAPRVTDVTLRGTEAAYSSKSTLERAGRGSHVNVSALITDEQLRMTPPSGLYAQLVNSTMGLQTAPTELREDPRTGRWWASIQIPTEWPGQDYELRAKITATDAAGNTMVATWREAGIAVSGRVPLVRLEAPLYAAPNKGIPVAATVKEQGVGIDSGAVRLLFKSLAGNFSNHESFNQTSDGFNVVPMRWVADHFEASLPPSEEMTRILMMAEARDLAGGIGLSNAWTLTVDATPPLLSEPSPVPFRGTGLQRFVAQVVDSQAGVDPNRTFVMLAQDGFQPRVMSPFEDGTFEIFLPIDADDSDQVEYFFSAADRAGNVAFLGTKEEPLTSLVDARPPDVSFSPMEPSASEATVLAWKAEDAASGVRLTTLQVRHLAAGYGAGWYTVFQSPDETRLLVCSWPGEYEFRVVAMDGAGNTAPSGEVRLQFLEPSCPERLEVTDVVVTRAESNGTSYEARWRASSSSPLAPVESLRITALFSPDGGINHFPLPGGLSGQTAYGFEAGELPHCQACSVRIQLFSPSGQSRTADSQFFSNPAGRRDADLDRNGLPDSWELQFVGALRRLSVDADPDGDGLTNAEEARLRTNPLLADTDHDLISDHDEWAYGTNPLDASSLATVPESSQTWFPRSGWGLLLLTGLGVTLYIFGLAKRWNDPDRAWPRRIATAAVVFLLAASAGLIAFGLEVARPFAETIEWMPPAEELLWILGAAMWVPTFVLIALLFSRADESVEPATRLGACDQCGRVRPLVTSSCEECMEAIGSNPTMDAIHSELWRHVEAGSVEPVHRR